MNAPSASLRSENSKRQSAVEMTPRGKRGKLKNQKRVFPSFHRAWKSGIKQKRRISTLFRVPDYYQVIQFWPCFGLIIQAKSA